MGLFGKSKAEKIAELKEKQSMLNGRELKKLLKKLNKITLNFQIKKMPLLKETA